MNLILVLYTNDQQTENFQKFRSVPLIKMQLQEPIFTGQLAIILKLFVLVAVVSVCSPATSITTKCRRPSGALTQDDTKRLSAQRCRTLILQLNFKWDTSVPLLGETSEKSNIVRSVNPRSEKRPMQRHSRFTNKSPSFVTPAHTKEHDKSFSP